MDSLLPMDLATLIQAVRYLGIFLIVFADSGVLLGLISPGDSLLLTAGLLASQGHLNLWLLMLVAALGAILGDAAGYAFGKRMGPQLFTRKASWLCTTRHLDHARHFYACHGGKTIVLARFLHFVRTLAPMVAGAADMHYGTFLFSLNFSEFVDGRNGPLSRGWRCYETLLFARNWLANKAEGHSVSASMYALQTVLN